MHIRQILTDSGSQFTDRSTCKAKRPSGQHRFDLLCLEMGIDHRPIPARHPETNALVERFNGRISDLVQQTRFACVAEPDATLTNYLEMMKAGYDYGFVVPSELLLHAKALTTAESLIFVLDSDARFEKLSCPFIAREYAARISSLTRLKKRVSQLAPELLLVGEFLPPEAVDETGDWNATVDLLTKMRTHFGGAVQSSLERGGLRQTLVEPHARMALKATPIGELTGKILSEAWDRHYELEPSLAIEPTIQAIFTTHLAVATLVLHEVLLRQGNSANESHRLIWDIGWKIYVQMAKSRCMSQAR